MLVGTRRNTSTNLFLDKRVVRDEWSCMCQEETFLPSEYENKLWDFDVYFLAPRFPFLSNPILLNLFPGMVRLLSPLPIISSRGVINPFFSTEKQAKRIVVVRNLKGETRNFKWRGK